MSLAYQQLKRSNVQHQRSRKLEEAITLSDEQREEMCSLAERVSSEDLIS